MIRTFGFTFNKGSYGKLTPKENGLHVHITASADNRDIREISGSLRTSEFTVEAMFHSQLDIGAIAFMTNQQFNKQQVVDPDLMTMLEGYIASLSEEDVAKLAELLPIESKEKSKQRIVDLFLIRISIYLLGLAFLSQMEVMSSLPFQFSLPFDVIDGNVLGKGMFDYLTIPIRAILASGAEGEVVDLVGLMNEFINEWDGLFELGKRYDTAKVTIEVLNGYIGYTTAFIGKVKEIADKVLKQLPPPSPNGKIEVTSARLDRLELQIDNIIQLLEVKTDPFDIMKLASKINKLESEVERLKGRNGQRSKMD